MKTSRSDSRSWLLLALLPGAMAANAANAANNGNTKVYRCVKDGVVVFSQQKCALDAEQVTVKLKQGLPESPEKAAQKYRDEQRSVEQYLQQRDVERMVARHEANVERLKAKMADEFAKMQTLRYRTPQQKQTALDGLKRKYDGLISAEHEAIKALKQPSKPAEQTP